MLYAMLLGPHVVEGILNFIFSLLVAGGRICGVVLLLLPPSARWNKSLEYTKSLGIAHPRIWVGHILSSFITNQELGEEAFIYWSLAFC